MSNIESLYTYTANYKSCTKHICQSKHIERILQNICNKSVRREVTCQDRYCKWRVHTLQALFLGKRKIIFKRAFERGCVSSQQGNYSISFSKKILAMSSVLLSFYVFWGIMSTYVIVSYYIYSKPNPRHPLHQLMMSKGCPITLRNAYIIWVPLKKTFSVSGNRRKEPYRDGDCQLCTAKVTSNSLEYRAAKPSWRTSWKSKRLGQLAEREEVDVRYLASCRIS